MDYKIIYDNLIIKAQLENRKKCKKSSDEYIYYERHHIIPRCLNGSNDKSNLVLLTGKEHFLAHLLLIKIYPTVPRLVTAAVKMRGNRLNYNASSRMYEWLRKRHAESVSLLLTGKEKSEEHKRNLSISGKGKHRTPKTEEHKKKISIAHTGKKRGEFSDEWKANLSAAGKKKIFTDEHRENLSKAATGKKRKPFSEEHRHKLSEAGKRRFSINKDTYNA